MGDAGDVADDIVNLVVGKGGAADVIYFAKTAVCQSQHDSLHHIIDVHREGDMLAPIHLDAPPFERLFKKEAVEGVPAPRAVKATRAQNDDR